MSSPLPTYALAKLARSIVDLYACVKRLVMKVDGTGTSDMSQLTGIAIACCVPRGIECSE